MHLDFIRPYRRSATSGWLLLVLGMAMLGGVAGWHYLEFLPRLERQDAQLSRLQAELTAREPAAVRMSNEELSSEWSRAAKVAGDLGAPWAPLFALLDGGAGESIALLALEPDGTRHELILTGEARNYAALLDYYRYLQKQTMLHAVALQMHQVSRQDKDKPVRFRITAHWEAA